MGGWCGGGEEGGEEGRRGGGEERWGGRGGVGGREREGDNQQYPPLHSPLPPTHSPFLEVLLVLTAQYSPHPFNLQTSSFS